MRKEMKKMRNMAKSSILVLFILTMVITFAGCGQNSGGSEAQSSSSATEDIFAGGEAVDLTVYDSMKDSKEDSMFVDLEVKDIAKLMDDKETFVFMATFANCPFCNRVIPYVNEAAKKAGIHVGYLDTRKDPKWKNNMDIKDYDLFVKYFGKYVKKDADGTPHLYTPHTFFIKDGKVVAEHQGVIEGADDPSKELAPDQEMALKELLDGEFGLLK